MSKRGNSRGSSRYRSTSHSWNDHGYSPSPSAQPSRDYLPQQHYAPPTQSYVGQAPGLKKRLERKYSKIEDNYNTLEQVTLYEFMFSFVA